MTALDIIKLPIKEELIKFEPLFRKEMESDVPFLNTVMHNILRRKGKQMRPLFVFLSAKMCGEFNDLTYKAAASIELLHTATLIHDDVVDESYERRGSFSVNALWKNKIAVLVGDFILAQGMIIALKYKVYRLLDLTARAVKDMSEGEILQLRKSWKLDIDDDTYFEIIRKKTASLIATSMAVGAASVTDDDEVVERMFQIGLNVGIAFQIKDDIFDYQQKGLLGKPTGNDIKEKKITLPLLYVLNNCEAGERRHILRLIKKKNKSRATVKELVDLVTNRGGLEYAAVKMNEFCEKAIAEIKQFPESEARNSLVELVNYTITRTK